MKTKLAHLGWDISFQKQELGLCIIYLFSKLNSGEFRQHQILRLCLVPRKYQGKKKKYKGK